MFTARGSWKPTRVPGQDTRASGDTNAGRRQDHETGPLVQKPGSAVVGPSVPQGTGTCWSLRRGPRQSPSIRDGAPVQEAQGAVKTSHHCPRHRNSLLLSLGDAECARRSAQWVSVPSDWRRSTPRAPETSEATNACSDHNGFLVYRGKKLNRGLRTQKLIQRSEKYPNANPSSCTGLEGVQG